MRLYIFIPGLFLLILTIYDIVVTTLAPSGAGLISGSISKSVWRLFSFFKNLTGNRNILSGIGVITMVSIIANWVILLWLANVLIFSSVPESVVNATTKAPANLKQLIYYTGYVLSTMGNGDFNGGSDGWRIYSSVISFTGLIFITIAITYMVQVLSAITERRTLSIRIASIGHSAQAMLLNNWNGKDFKMLGNHFQGLEQSIARQGQLHLAYPILHFFHQTEKKVSLLPNMAALDEAITLLLLYVPEEKRPAKEYLVPMRIAVTSFIESLHTLENISSGEPPALKTEALLKTGIHLLEPDKETLDQVMYRRRILKKMVNLDGWDWEDLSRPVLNSELDVTSKITL